MDEPSQMLQVLNGLAGIAALVNSLIMWPTVKYLKSLEPRVERLERAQAAKARRKPRAK